MIADNLLIFMRVPECKAFQAFVPNVLPETILEYYVTSIQSSIFPKTRPQEIIIGRKTSKNQSKKDQDF